MSDFLLSTVVSSKELAICYVYCANPINYRGSPDTGKEDNDKNYDVDGDSGRSITICSSPYLNAH